MIRYLLLLVATAAIAGTPAAARDTLGVFGGWAAFRDAKPRRCYAISEPDRAIMPDQARWRPFFAVSDWRGHKVKGQVHLRLAKPRKPGTALRLTVGAARFDLVSAGPEAWAPDAATDAAIVAAMRISRRATATGLARDGTAIRDGYSLKGAATAVDAVRLACGAKG